VDNNEVVTELEKALSNLKLAAQKAGVQTIQPRGQPLEPWTEDTVPVSDEEIDAAIAEWDETKGLPPAILSARVATPEEEAEA
jgi:hypothetical protein